MNEGELFPGVDAAGGLRAGFARRSAARAEDSRASASVRAAATSTSSASSSAPATRNTDPVRAHDESGYELGGEIARGGMGVIVKARDRELGRDVALKVLRDDLASGDSHARFERRFLEEARVTARLDHPGIVPVHEVGRDAHGRAYFAMRLVRGRELRRIFELADLGAEGWNRTRALSVIQKVCEAMAYAHDKGVIHRDLKPSNVMVGEFGEVYVMDWGLARRIGDEDAHDLRLRESRANASHAPANASDAPANASHAPANASHAPANASIAAPAARGSREDARERERATSSSLIRDLESPIVTMDGEVLGTPCYMSPEQAQGRIADLGPRSDVYSVGAMLYHLLAGEMPYVPAGTSVASRRVLLSLVQGPPRALDEVRGDVPSELAAICEKAMARDARDRYASMLAMADDLRAYLERRVVSAYETGAFAEAKKWVQRNKALAAAMSLAVLALAVGLVVSLMLKSQSDANFARAEVSARLASDERDRALKIASFLEDTLSGVSTSVALGRDTTMLREMMDAAWSRIEHGELAAAPSAEVRLTLVIGSALRDVGEFDKAEPILRRGLEGAQHLDPPDELLVAATENELGMLLRDRGDLDDAERMHRDALAIRRRMLPADHALIASSLQNIATVLVSRGDQEGAETFMRDALAMNRRVFEGDRRELATNLINLGNVLQARGRYADAEQCFRDAIAMQERMFRGDHPELASSYDNLGSLLLVKGDLPGAEEFERRGLEMRRRILPHDHADLAGSLNNVATVLQSRGDFAGAETNFREALEIQRRVFPGDHIRVAANLGNLATLAHSRGDLDAAEPLYREALAMQRRLFAGDRAEIAQALSNLSMLLDSRGDLAGAEALLREALDMQHRLFHGDHPDVAHVEAGLALVLMRRGDTTGAEPLYRDALEMRRRLYPRGNSDVAKSNFDLARIYKGRSDFAAAAPLYRDALRMYRASGPESAIPLAQTEIELGQVLTRTSHFAEAEELLLDAAAILERDPGREPAWYQACVERIIENDGLWERAEPGAKRAARVDEWRAKLDALGKK